MSLRKLFATALLALSMTTFAGACTSSSPTNLIGVSWTYCSDTNQLTLTNSGVKSMFLRIEVLVRQNTEKYTLTVHPGQAWVVAVGEPTKVKITDWVLYNRHSR